MTDEEKVIRGLYCCLKHEVKSCKICPYFGECSNIYRPVELMRDVMKNEEDRWIPVSEAVPKNMANKVIVYLQHEDLVPYIGYGHYERYKGEEIWYDLENNVPFAERGYTVTHWMPMPRSPEGKRLTLN